MHEKSGKTGKGFFIGTVDRYGVIPSKDASTFLTLCKLLKLFKILDFSKKMQYNKYKKNCIVRRYNHGQRNSISEDRCGI